MVKCQKSSNSNNSILHKYTVSMSKTVLFQTVQFSISTHFSPTWSIDRKPIRCYHFMPQWTWEKWQRRGTPHSPKFQYNWNLTIRLFSIISRTLVGGVLPLCREAVSLLFYDSSRLGKDRWSDVRVDVVVETFSLLTLGSPVPRCRVFQQLPSWSR